MSDALTDDNKPLDPAAAAMVARVRRLMLMEGRSVLATFKALAEFEGRTLDELRSGTAFGHNQKGHEAALAQAIAQIDNAKGAAPPAGVTALQAAAM